MSHLYKRGQYNGGPSSQMVQRGQVINTIITNTNFIKNPPLDWKYISIKKIRKIENHIICYWDLPRLMVFNKNP
jgi:hypothetical protein